MKKLFGTAILIITAITVYAGGGGEQTGSTNSGSVGAQTGSTNSAPATAAQLATQLAAELNALNEGSARLSGNTVTLTRNVGVQGNLTVPAGVTLDLTGDSGIWIQRDGVTLTVNGTVNTPSNRIGFDSGSGARTMIINGNGTINLTSKGGLINIGGAGEVKKKLTLDGVIF